MGPYTATQPGHPSRCRHNRSQPRLGRIIITNKYT